MARNTLKAMIVPLIHSRYKYFALLTWNFKFWSLLEIALKGSLVSALHCSLIYCIYPFGLAALHILMHHVVHQSNTTLWHFCLIPTVTTFKCLLLPVRTEECFTSSAATLPLRLFCLPAHDRTCWEEFVSFVRRCATAAEAWNRGVVCFLSLIDEPRAAEHVALLLRNCFCRLTQAISLRSVTFTLWDESHIELSTFFPVCVVRHRQIEIFTWAYWLYETINLS